MAEMKPALTPEEWAMWTDENSGGPDPCADHNRDWDKDRPGALLATAALAFHDYPFYFTWDDVDAVRTASQWDMEPGAYRLLKLADRIAALLPPRENDDVDG